MKKLGCCLVLAIAILSLFLSGCGKKQNRNGVLSKEPIKVNEVTIPDGQGRMPQRQALPLPDEGVVLYNAAESVSQVYLFGRNTEREPKLYVFSKEDLNITALPKTDLDAVVDISATEGEELYVLGISQEGAYTITILDQTGDSSTLTLDARLYQDDSIFGLTATENYFFLKTPRTIYAANKSGEFLKDLRSESTFAQVLALSPEKTLLVDYGTTDKAGKSRPTMIHELSPDLSIGDSYEVNAGFSQFFPNDGDVLLAQLGGSIFEYNYKTGDCQPLMNFRTGSMELMGLSRLDEDQFFSIDKGEACVWTLTEELDSNLITLYTYSPSYDLLKATEEFNNSQNGCVIQVIDYAQYNTFHEQAGKDRLNADIISGKTPDVYDLAYWSEKQLAEKGLLENLKPYFDSDDDLPYSSLVPSAAKVLENRDGLYQCVPYFNVITTAVDKSVAQNEFTFTQLRELVERESLRKVFGPEMTRELLLAYALCFMADELYSTENISCNFNSETFVTVLNWMSKLPETQELFDGNESLPLGSAYVGELMVLITESGLDIPTDISAADTVFSGAAQYLGFPSEAGGGFALVPEISLGMSSTSQNKDNVWAFFKFLLNRTNVSGNGLPIVQEYLEQCLDRRINWIQEKVHSSSAMSPHGFVNIPLQAFEQDEIKARIMEIVGKINCLAQYDQDIYKIIYEQCQPMFSGNMSPEAAAAQIQSRVSIYLAEQYG